MKKFLLNLSFILVTFCSFSQTLKPYYPNYNSLAIENNQDVKWSGISNAIDYHLQVSVDSTFTTTSINQQNILTTSYTISSLVTNQTFFWRVRYRSAQGYSQWSYLNKFRTFTPENLTGMTIYLKADAGITLNGSNVSAWADQSGNNYIAQQSTSSKQPLINLNAANGKPSVKFDGVDDFLDLNTSFDLLNFSIVFILRPNQTIKSNTASQTILCTSSAKSVNCMVSIANIMGAISGEILSYCSFGSTNLVSYIKDTVSKHIDIITSNLSNANFTTSLNNSPCSTYSYSSGGLNASIGRSLQQIQRIGAQYDNSTTYNGEIFEIIIYNREITSTEKALINQYASAKYTPGNVELGDNIIKNYGFCKTAISAPANYSTYHWSTGETTQTIQASSGSFWVEATDILGLKSSDTILISGPSLSLKDSLSCINSHRYIKTNLTDTHYQYSWSDFTNNSTTTPSFFGNYTVTVTDTSSCTNIKTINISPLVYFKTENTCKNVPFQFTDLSSVPTNDHITSWNWNFGDGNNSTLQNPTHIYTSGNIYTVQLTVRTSNGCTLNYDTTIMVINSALLPQSFKLNSPLDNFQLTSKHITFNWRKSTNAYKYTIQLAIDSLFNTISNSFNNIYDTTYSSNNFPLGKNYYWRVVAYNTCGDVFISNVQKIIAFIPSTISNMNIWLMADSNTTTNSGILNSWQPINTTSAFTQSITNACPTLVNNVINGKPVIRFDGIANYMDYQSEIDLQDFSIFAVFKSKLKTTPSNSSRQTLISNAQDNSPNCPVWMGPVSSSMINETMSFMSYNTYPDLKASYITSDIDSTFQLLNANLNVDIFTLWINNNTPTINSHTNGGLNSSINRSLDKLKRIGAYVGPSDFFNGDIAEIIIYNKSLSSNEQSEVLSYLRNKYVGPPVNLGPDIKVSYGFCPITLNASTRFSQYLWSTGEKTSSIQVKNGGTYWVRVKDMFGFISSDTINIIKPKVILKDTTICYNTTATLNLNIGNNYAYLWSTAETTQSITIGTAGNIWYSITDTLHCNFRDTLKLSIDSFQITTSLGSDRNFCDGDSLKLLVGQAKGNLYHWSNGSTNSIIPIHYPGGDYHVTVTNTRSCVARDTVHLTIIGYAPVVNFTAPSGCLNYFTNFIDNSTISPTGTISTRQWSFGDNTNFSGLNPTHQFADTGSYHVTLLITTDVGCAISSSKTVQVYPLPTAYFTPTNGCTASPINFRDKSKAILGNLTSWNWSFGDSKASSIENPIHSYDTIGNYNVRLITQTNYGCVDTIIRIVKIKQSPDIDFSSTNVCIGTPVTFWDISNAPNYHPISNWRWDFGDATIDSTKNPTHYFSIPGMKNVTLTLKSLSGCTVSKTKSVMVYNIPNAKFTVTNLCVDQPLNIADSSKVSTDSLVNWEWKISNNSYFNGKNPKIIISDTGLYNINLIVTSSGGCKDSVSIPLTINPSIKSYFDYSPHSGTAPLIVSFQNNTVGSVYNRWTFGDNSVPSYISNPNYQFNSNGVYILKLYTENEFNCADSTSYTINIMPTTLDLAIINVSYIEIDNQIRLNITFANIGTRPIENFNISAQISGGTAITETWIGTLESGQSDSYTFHATFDINTASKPDYLCTKLTNINNGEEDSNLNNNESCIMLSDVFAVMDISPNPANESINIEFVNPIADNITISLYNVNGEIIGTLFNDTLDKGYHKIKSDINSLRTGIYAVRLDYRGKTITKRFVKS